jgi:hypothetical protein
MTAPLYTACGKQLLRDGQHFADLIGPAEAEALANVLNGQVLLDMPLEQQQRIVEVLWG